MDVLYIAILIIGLWYYLSDERISHQKWSYECLRETGKECLYR